MNSPVQLDPKFQSFETKLKLAGTAVIAVSVSGIVIAGSLAIVTAVGLGLLALAAVNFGIPVGARYITLKRQQAMTALAETFSTETIQKDEIEEGQRIVEQQQLYKKQAAEFGNIIDELHANMKNADPEEIDILQSQIDDLNRILTDGYEAITAKVYDFEELKRVNKLYIATHRAGLAMSSSQDLARKTEQIQQVETARTAIKTRMREAVAGKKLEEANRSIQQRVTVSTVMNITNTRTQSQPTFSHVTKGETVDVSDNR